MKLAAALIIFAALQGPVVNSPTPDVTTIKIPTSVSDDVTVCVDYKVDSTCIRVGDLRRYLHDRKYAH